MKTTDEIDDVINQIAVNKKCQVPIFLDTNSEIKK